MSRLPSAAERTGLSGRSSGCRCCAEVALTARDVIGGAPIVIRDGSKRTHIREICRRAGLPLDRKIVFFDDKLADCREAEELGVTAVHCEDGLTVPLLLEGARRAASDNDS